MSEVACYMLERTNLARVWLRRYASTHSTSHHYHDARAAISDAENYDSEWEGDGTQDADKTDPRFPTSCGCGYVFVDSDEWQVMRKRLYRAPSGVLEPPEDHAPGALWFSPWMGDGGWCAADGTTLTMLLPDKTPWVIDGPAGNAPGKLPGWDRTGVPPNITVTPSIQTPQYHGILTNGVLRSC